MQASDAAENLISAPSSSFVVSPNTATQVVFGVQPTNTTAGVPISAAVTVKIEDQFGNVETADSRVQSGYCHRQRSQRGRLRSGEAATSRDGEAAGTATFASLKLDTAGSYTLQASDAALALTGGASNGFVVSPGAAAQIILGQQPSNTTAGVAFNPALTAKIEDQFGNLETGDNSSALNIGIASGPTGAVFAPGSNATATVNAGVATFTPLALDTVGSYTLRASDPALSLTSPASNSFAVSPGATAQLVFGQAPTNATAGVTLNPAVTVKMEDTFGNVETADNGSSLSLGIVTGPAGAVFAGGSTMTTTVNAGVAIFTALQLNTAGTYTLQASDAALALTSAASSSFVVNPNAAAAVLFGQQPSNATAGAGAPTRQ